MALDLSPQAAEILESVSDAFYALDADWRFAYVNRRAEELWGIRRERLLGRNIWEAFPRSVGGVAHAELLKAARDREERHFELYSEVMGAWLEVSACPTDGGGLCVYFRDVSARKGLEEERYWLLREAQSRAAELTATMQSLPDALFIGNEAVVTLANAPALALLGCATVEELNRNRVEVEARARARDAATGEPLPLERWPLFRAAATGRPIVQDLILRDASTGRDTLLRCSAAPVRLEGELIGAACLSADVMRSRERALLRGLLYAQEEERRALAYELHDGLTQYVLAAHAHLESARFLERAPCDDGAAARLERRRAEERLAQAVSESRRLVNGLRALALEDLGLAQALEQLLAEEKAAAGWSEARMAHNVADRRFDPALETAAYRVAQEALTNVRKHAGARRVRLTLLLSEDAEEERGEGGGGGSGGGRHSQVLTLEVRDWGRGFAPEEAREDYAHLGLHGMQERVSLAGGSFRLSSARGGGTTVRAVFPLEPDGLAPGGDQAGGRTTEAAEGDGGGDAGDETAAERAAGEETGHGRDGASAGR